MRYPCFDYHAGVAHAPHDWTLGDTPVECPGLFGEDGGAAVPAELDNPLPNMPGSMKKELVAA